VHPANAPRHRSRLAPSLQGRSRGSHDSRAGCRKGWIKIHQGRSITRVVRCSIGADDRRRQGMGASGAHRQSLLLGAANSAGNGCRPNRPFGSHDRDGAQIGGSRLGSGEIGPETRISTWFGSHLSHGKGDGHWIRTGRDNRMHRSWTSNQRVYSPSRLRGNCLPYRHRVTADLAADAVLKNKAVVGSVNGNKRHWFKGGEALARADRNWLSRLISRREKPEKFAHALEREPHDIKVVIQFCEA
jgi:Glucose dehydrogenase C-terminus